MRADTVEPTRAGACHGLPKRASLLETWPHDLRLGAVSDYEAARSCDRRGWSVRSGRRARRDLDDNHTVRGSECRLRRRLERFAIKVIAVGD
jgi:hypothetical protein